MKLELDRSGFWVVRLIDNGFYREVYFSVKEKAEEFIKAKYAQDMRINKKIRVSDEKH